MRYLPQFVTPHLPQLSGVDFLGIRQVNFDLMDRCIPGINNVAVNVRCFSVMSWAYWKLHQISQIEPAMSLEDMERFREKVEILFTMGHKHRGLSVPGGDMKPAKGGHDPHELTFEYWSRINSSTGLTSAIQYGPPLSSTSGIGCTTVDYETGLRLATEKGAQLAEALDEVLINSDGYHLVDNLSDQSATFADAESLMNYWSIESVSDKEAAAFRSLLHPLDSESRKSRIRIETIHYIQGVLEDGPIPENINSLRSAMFLGCTIDGQPISWTDEFSNTHRSWVILQIRQLQRLTIEALYSLLEQYIDTIHTDIVGMIDEFVTSAGLDSSEKVLEVFNVVGEFNSIDDLLDHASTEPSVDPVIFAEEFESAINSGDLKILAQHIWKGLSLTYVYARLAGSEWSNDELSWMLGHGGDRQHSLQSYLDYLNDNQNITVSAFVGHMMGLVVTMHLYITAVRFEPGKMKSRLFVDGDRIDRIATTYFKPYRTQDRLYSLVSLMKQCGLVA